MRRTKRPEIGQRPDCEKLAPSELEGLRRSTREADAYLAKAFKNHAVDLGVKEDGDFDTPAVPVAGDASPAGVDSAAQEQPGTVRTVREGRDRVHENRSAPRKA